MTFQQKSDPPPYADRPKTAGTALIIRHTKHAVESETACARVGLRWRTRRVYRAPAADFSRVGSLSAAAAAAPGLGQVVVVCKSALGAVPILRHVRWYGVAFGLPRRGGDESRGSGENREDSHLTMLV